MKHKNMTIPDTQPPPEPAEPTPKPRRKRRTKAEIEAERAAQIAEANKPIDPQVWFLFGGLLLIVGACIFFDPLSFVTGGQPSSQTWIQVALALIVGILGKNPTAIILAVLALLSLGWGVRGWLRKRAEKNDEPKPV